MGKDKKEKNPADAYRKELRKKELLKLKKERIVVKEVRDLLNDPLKIDEEIKKAQKVSDENKLDKSLKDRIKELQRMKEVALTKQLVLEASGKVVKNSLINTDDSTNSSAIDGSSGQQPSIYQRNSDVPMPVVDPSLTSADHNSSTLQYSHDNDQDHINAVRSRISTAGLELHGKPSDLSSSLSLQDIAVPQPTILPYSQLPSFHMAPVPPPGYGPSRDIPPPPPIAPPFMGRSMGGVGGIPLPPPRPPPVNYDAAAPPMLAVQFPPPTTIMPSTSYMYSSSIPPPPPPPLMMQMSSSYGAGSTPIPPFQVQVQGEQSSYASSMYGMVSAAAAPSMTSNYNNNIINNNNNPYHPKDRRSKNINSNSNSSIINSNNNIQHESTTRCKSLL